MARQSKILGGLLTIEKLSPTGLLLIKPDVFKDSRGYFFESYNEKKLLELGFKEKFVQDNISKSTFATIRGLHYQVGNNAQGKLCQVIEGKVLDVALDIRFGSPTFGQHYSVELSNDNNFQLWIPPGFAHGFSVLSETALFFYKCTAFYSKGDERSIRFDDSDLKIDWEIENPVVSEKDRSAGSFSEIGRDFKYKVI